MTYNDFIKAVAKEADFTQADTKVLLDAMKNVMADALTNGDTVPLKDFGKFTTKTHAARSGHNPRTGEVIEIPEKTAVKFHPSGALKTAINS